MQTLRIGVVTTALAIAATGCGNGDDSPATPTPAPTSAANLDAGNLSIDAECPVIVSDTTCDTTQRPIVFVHGTYGAGDNIANVARLFASNGYCPDRFISIDYNSLIAVGGGLTGATISGPTNAATPAIDAAIDAVLAATGFTQVDIMGHSQGALQLYTYLEDPAAAAKVAHYVQLAGGPESDPPGPPDAAGIPTLSISSYGDIIAGPVGVTGAQQTVVYESQDHVGVAASTDTFVAIWRYLHVNAQGVADGTYPTYTSIQCGDPTITLSGKTETFGDNALPPGGSLQVWVLNSPQQDGGTPLMTFPVGDAGLIGPWQAQRLTQYEFRGVAADGGIIGHIYYEPFKRSDYWLRFLVPSSDPVASVVTNPLTNLDDNAETTIIARKSTGSFRYDLGDTLTVNGFEALNANDASRQSITWALFMYDVNKDSKSEGGSIETTGVPFFVRSTDVFVASTPPAFVTVSSNGHVMQIPNWPSETQGVTYVLFQ